MMEAKSPRKDMAQCYWSCSPDASIPPPKIVTARLNASRGAWATVNGIRLQPTPCSMRRHLLDLTAQEASSTRTRLEGGRALKANWNTACLGRQRKVPGAQPLSGPGAGAVRGRRPRVCAREGNGCGASRARSTRLCSPCATVPNTPSAQCARTREEEPMPDRPPVSDWSSDFDHTDPRWVDDPFPIWNELRQPVSRRTHGAVWRCVSADAL